MKRALNVVFIVLLLLGAFPYTLSVSEPGNISFEPGIISDLTVTAGAGRHNESFRFTWPGNRLDIELFFNATKHDAKKGDVTKIFSLNDFKDDFNVTVETVINKTETYLQFGWVIPGPDNADVHNAYFKIEDTSFDVDRIEVNTYPANETEITVYSFPGNLDLTFKDLETKGFALGYRDKTTLSITGFRGKKTFNLDPIVYSVDTITVIGGSAGSPLEFDDIYNADISNNYTILEDYVYHNPPPATLIRYFWVNPLRPADSKALSLFYDVWNYSTGGSLKFVGKDLLGNLQSETHTITGAVSSRTTLFYTVLDQIEFTGANYTLTVKQDRWGLVWKQLSDQYAFDVKLQFGNGTVAGTTYFNDTQKQITFNDGVLTAQLQTWMTATDYVHIQFGELVDLATKSTSKGCMFVSLEDTYAPYIFYSSANVGLSSNNFFSCMFTSHRSSFIFMRNMRLWNSLLTRLAELSLTTEGDIFNVHIYNTGSALGYPRGKVEKVYIFSCGYGAYLGYDGTISNAYFRDNTYIVRIPSANMKSFYAVNWDCDNWALSQASTAVGELYRQYTFDLTVTYPNGSAVNNANVTLRNYGLNATIVFNGLTNSSGQIQTLTLTGYHYNYTGGDTPYNYNPYNLNIVDVSGYNGYSANFTVDYRKDFEISLTPSTEAIGGAVYLAPGFFFGFAVALAVGIVIWKD